MKTPPAPDPRVFQARAFPATDFATVLGALGTASAANKTTNTLTITRQSAAPFLPYSGRPRAGAAADEARADPRCHEPCSSQRL